MVRIFVRGWTRIAKTPFSYNGEGGNASNMDVSRTQRTLPLAELESSSSALASVLLSLFHSRISGKQTYAAQPGTMFGIDLQKSLGDAVADGSCLPGETTALAERDDIEPALRLGNIK